MKMKRDENGVIMPVKTESVPEENITQKVRNSINSSENAPKMQQNAAENEENAPKTQRKPIGKEELDNAKQTLNKYLASKKVYDVRYKNNFDTYNLMYTENDIPDVYTDDEGNKRERIISRKTGAQCLNVIMNKHADAMDNYPEAICLPRAADDEQTAEMLNSVLPCVLERNGFQNTYSDEVYDKLIGGVGVFAVLWDSSKENGLGDIAIVKADILSLAWKPHIENIQDSPNLFCLKLYDTDEVKNMYPQLENVGTENMGIEEYRTYDNDSKTHDKAVIVDWYYKKDGKLHLCKWCGDEILFASENEPEKYPKGFYEHGLYPFIFDPMYKLRDTPVGFSMVDICRWPQKYLDGLKVDILKNIKVNSQTRSLFNSGAGLNAEDLADLNKEYVECDNVNDNIIKPLETKDIAAGALNMYNALIDEMKETTGTNDASSGASAAGVTSGSAIAALQEAGGKISRDSNKQSYFAFVEICNMVIELMRQFYTLPRFFRITGKDNDTQYVDFDNSGLLKQEIPLEGNPEEIFERLPIFDIKVKAQRANPFTTSANNQMMMEMFGAGMFAPQNADAALIALEGMSFEGKENIVKMIQKNQTLEQTVVELTDKLKMSNAMLASTAAQQAGMTPTAPQVGGMQK